MTIGKNSEKNLSKKDFEALKSLSFIRKGIEKAKKSKKKNS